VKKGRDEQGNTQFGVQARFSRVCPLCFAHVHVQICFPTSCVKQSSLCLSLVKGSSPWVFRARCVLSPRLLNKYRGECHVHLNISIAGARNGYQRSPRSIGGKEDLPFPNKGPNHRANDQSSHSLSDLWIHKFSSAAWQSFSRGVEAVLWAEEPIAWWSGHSPEQQDIQTWAPSGSG